MKSKKGSAFRATLKPIGRRFEMATQALAVQSASGTSPSVHAGPPNDEIKEVFDRLARRAFSIFESNGHVLGRDIDDWFQAERELFHPTHLDVSESDQNFTVRAEVPGFTPKELEINIEGQRLTISGKREKHEERKDKKMLYSESCSDEILRVLDLPAEVNATGATANLKNGILVLEIPKAAPAKKIASTPKTA
jgi:HSP20 family molecular chaperone IbpA